jgi:putative ABC transport system permease protein
MKTILLTFRKLKKSKTATSLGIAGLVVGLVCVMYIFFWVSNEASYDRFHKNIDRIFVVHAYLEGGTKKVDFRGCPPAVAPALKEEYPEVENTCRYIPPYYEFLLSADGKKDMLKMAFSESSLFDIFTLPFVYGSPGEPDDPNQLVLTQTSANRIFGNENPVGKIVRFNNSTDMTIAGVIKDIPTNSSIQFDAVLPIQNLKIFYGRDDFLTTWYNNGFTTYGLLHSPNGFDKIASTITRRIQKEMPESTNYLRAYKFKNGYLYEQNNIRNVRIFSLIGLLVLIAAILNFINLITARSTKQAKETGMRKSIGATRGNIIKLVYSDVAILCLLAFVAAFLIAILGLPLFSNLIGRHIELQSLFAMLPMGILLLIYLVTVFLGGSYPAFFLSSFSVSETLKSNFQSVKNKGFTRNSLVVSIFVVSIILLTSSFIISKQTIHLQRMDIGYNKEQLLYIKLDGKLKEKVKALKDEIGRSPEVASASVTDFLPIVIGNNGEGWNWEGKDVNFKPLVTNWRTDENLVETLGAKMIEGSFFSNDRRGIVINKAFADVIGWKSFTGKKLNTEGTDYTIVGVINNIQYNSLSESCRPMAIQPAESWSANYLIVRTNAGQIDKTIGFIRKTCETIEPDYPFNYGFVDDKFAQLLESETNLGKLVGIFSVFAMTVLCLGLLGVVMFMAEQKTKEIGVRKCLGERVSSIIVSLIKPFVLSGLVASVIAVPATWFIMNRWLQGYTNRIELSLWIFVLAVFISIAIAVVTVSWQSWRVATRNPVEALRYE